MSCSAAVSPMAVMPAASVSGFYFAHPDARYFAVGKIGKDQALDYQARKNAPQAVDCESLSLL